MPHPGLALKVARVNAGISQTKLSEESGVPYIKITQITSGKKKLRRSDAVKLARVLKVKPDTLWWGGPIPTDKGKWYVIHSYQDKPLAHFIYDDEEKSVCGQATRSTYRGSCELDEYPRRDWRTCRTCQRTKGKARRRRKMPSA